MSQKNISFKSKENLFFEKIINFLNDSQVNYKLVEIDLNNSSEENSRMIGTTSSQEVKSLLLIGDEKTYFAIVGRSNKIDFSKLKKILGVKNLTMVIPEEVKKITGVEIGSVPPFGNLIKIPVYFDSALTKEDKIAFSAGTNNKIIVMTPSDFVKIINPKIFDFIKI